MITPGKTLATRLKPGLYVVHWKSGGSSLAAVGCVDNGLNWFAAVNWTSSEAEGIASTRHWRLVARVEPLCAWVPAVEDPDDWYAAEVARMAERAPA